MAEELGLRPVRVEDGEQALVVLARWGTPSLSVVELSLPLVDGFGVLERLRASSPKPRVIAVSPFRTLRGFAAYSASRLGIDVVLPRASTRGSVLHAAAVLLGHKADVGEHPREPSKTRLRPVRPHEPGVAPPDARLGWFVDRVVRELGVEAAMARVELDDGRMLVATSGLDAREARRTEPFYRLVVEASALLVVPDAPTNPFFHEEPAVRSGYVRGYAGAPLIDEAGRARGSLSVFTSRAAMPARRPGARDAHRSRCAARAGPVLPRRPRRATRRRRLARTLERAAPRGAGDRAGLGRARHRGRADGSGPRARLLSYEVLGSLARRSARCLGASSGRVTTKRVPVPCSLVTPIVPPCASTMRRLM